MWFWIIVCVCTFLEIHLYMYIWSTQVYQLCIILLCMLSAVYPSTVLLFVPLPLLTLHSNLDAGPDQRKRQCTSRVGWSLRTSTDRQWHSGIEFVCWYNCMNAHMNGATDVWTHAFNLVEFNVCFYFVLFDYIVLLEYIFIIWKLCA